MTPLLKKFEENYIYEFFKNNYSVFLIISSLIGGFKQFINLFLYSPSLLQYFSFSQIGIDAIEIMIQIIYISILVGITRYTITKNSISINWFNSIQFATLAAYIYYLKSADTSITFNTYYFTNSATFFKFFSLTVLAFTITSLLETLTLNKNRKLITVITIFLAIFLIPISLYYIFVQKPFQYNVKNVYDLTNKIKNKTSAQAKLVYYNDTYLIFLLNPKESCDNKKFYIQKFEMLFDENMKK